MMWRARWFADDHSLRDPGVRSGLWNHDPVFPGFAVYSRAFQSCDAVGENHLDTIGWLATTSA